MCVNPAKTGPCGDPTSDLRRVKAAYERVGKDRDARWEAVLKRWIWIGGVALAVAAAVAAWSFSTDLKAARARLAGRSHVADSPYGPLEYADAGEGPVILLIHGSGGGFDQGLTFGASLPAQGFRVIAPSRFGYLRSAMPAEATPALQADALAWLLDELGVERAVIFGGSAGALSASQLAIRRPDLCRGLILGVPALYAPGRAPDTNPAPRGAVRAMIRAALGSDFLFWAGIKATPDLMTRLVLATDPALLIGQPASEHQRVRAVLNGILPIRERREGLLMDGDTAGAPPPYPISSIDCPILAVSTRDDLYGTGPAAEWTARQAKDGRAIIYSDGGHLWVGHDSDLWKAAAAFARNAPP